VVVERASQTAQVVLIANSTNSSTLADTAAQLISELGDGLHSLWWNGNPERSNTILGPHWELLHGPSAVKETVAGADVFFPPGAFGQSNLDMADRIVERIGSWVPSGARIAEFYAGCGSIGLGLLADCRRLVFNEIASDSLLGLELGLRARGERERSRAQVRSGPAGECLDLVRNAELVIADPPRRGLDPQLTQALAETPPSTFIYLSCGLDSFLRDCAQLSASHRLRLTALEAYALFPHTDHVETLARFSRVD
jgi:tRNA/tmRNA/rRNA uracil-C5-methylase (TrmA/RlmC/RlmD family)